ncbi:MAG TPA: heparinase II/III family protein, partial [Verrucomicrobiae bacterium]|nr:heparinase II/III family protein [Verrucomicrobiae bacterium]
QFKAGNVTTKVFGARLLPRWVLMVVAVLAFGLAATCRAAVTLDTNRVAEIAAMLPERPLGLGRPATDRAAWKQLARIPRFSNQIAQAEKLARSSDPELPDDLYLDFSRTGNRDRGQKVMFERANRVAVFTIAECLENKGRFLGPLTNSIGALCAEKTWVYPAHDGKLNNFYGRTVEMDLRATAVGWELATADFLLGDKLPPGTRQLIRDNVRRRVLQPFRDMAEGRRKEINWLRIKNNWNAVCLAGVTGAALALEDSPKDRAWFIGATEYYIRNFLESFTADGYCSEGLGYWNYGFGHFMMLGEMIRQNTGGKVDLLADPTALSAARFAGRDEILKSVYPSISDCTPGVQPDGQIVAYLDERLRLAGAGNRETVFSKPAGTLMATALFAFLPERLPLVQQADAAGESPLRTWFPNGGVLICRDAPTQKAKFGAALKGGTNGEQHNHNDVGSFSVVLGRKMVVCDPGAEVYTARTFSARRYESKVLNSFGHAVPVIAGQLQRAGLAAHAEILRHEFTDDADTLAMDISSAYAVPELKKLERTFVFRRGQPSLTVRDEVELTSPQTFETALITWGDWKQVSPDEITIHDGDATVRVKIDTGGQPFTIRSEVLNEDVHTPTKPTRLGIVLNSKVEKAVVILTIAPEAADRGLSR